MLSGACFCPCALSIWAAPAPPPWPSWWSAMTHQGLSDSLRVGPSNRDCSDLKLSRQPTEPTGAPTDVVSTVHVAPRFMSDHSFAMAGHAGSARPRHVTADVPAA